MKTARFILLFFLLVVNAKPAFCWGFFGHRKINFQAVFLLPPELIIFYKKHQLFLQEHSADPDKRRYALVEEAPRHYIDIDFYGDYPFVLLPRKWKDAVDCYTEDTLQAHGIAPWHISIMLNRLTSSFMHKDLAGILKNSAEIGHYIADVHVPLHTSSNHNGQLTNQKGIHAFWESRIPELLCDNEFDFFIGKANYINNPDDFVWVTILESAKAADSVLRIERALSEQFTESSKYAFEDRNGKLTKQYSSIFTQTYNLKLNGMVERRMRQAIFAVACFWYTAWINAGQPNLNDFSESKLNDMNNEEWNWLNQFWKSGQPILGREE